MFSYIYADGRGINTVLASRTKKGIIQQAFDYIKEKAAGETSFNEAKNPKLIQEPELKAVFDGFESNDIDATIEAWNKYQTIVHNNNISCHRIEEIKLIE